MPRSPHGGRHELGQNFLVHRPTALRIVDLVRRTSGPILELGAGDGALTAALVPLGRPLTAIDIDEHRVRRLRRALPGVRVEHADALSRAIDAPVVVGNIPFHLTTPILRRLLRERAWTDAVLLTQWEVARKRAGVGGGTMLTAQSGPWFEFRLEGRVPSHCFSPRPSVDGGVLAVSRRRAPLVADRERRLYERFVSAVFTGSGGALDRVLRRASGVDAPTVRRAMDAARVPSGRLPRDLTAEQWAGLWDVLRPDGGGPSGRRGVAR